MKGLNDIKDKKVLVVGMARSGVSAARVLKGLGCRVIANDIKKTDELRDVEQELGPLGIELYFGVQPDDIVEQMDMVVISPGVPIYTPFVQKAKENGIEVISEVELAYRLCSAPIVAITGTNGKTTTTSLIGEILKNAHMNTYIVGNIGKPFVAQTKNIQDGDVVVAEISSFQLEGIKYFKPKISVILNITPDHLNRHKTMENYINTKAKIFKNANENDYVVLNSDNSLSASLDDRTKGKVLFFSSSKVLDRGAWVQDGMVIVDVGNGKKTVCHVDDIFIPGRHNLENALAAVLVTSILGVDTKTIKSTLKSFKGVEHRIEFVDDIEEIKFYNDSKGTNPDASIKAIQAMKGPTVLIAGGMDKGLDFSDFIDAFDDIITDMVVLGETKDKLIQSASDKGFHNVYKVETLEQAVLKAYDLAVPGGNVLLSPACASWDMFKDYEERGRIFKAAVKALRR
ncbi:MAG: UDP-N-acetylmuramoyl-L-alanine--D-glutamate ligase [Xylanivirga thermophila]|uniref:UDP-N-acetylmuramoyl-L-alanine--D-glutamate ligase n=1 Tax=Xylanivirga thermophila TaxID=2496273 RepID=UPI00101C263C|nr:UDP-N-acetylmuramoyl-L-alanine--D-glutamate ligase [Xylanivirga thermophila]